MMKQAQKTYVKTFEAWDAVKVFTIYRTLVAIGLVILFYSNIDTFSVGNTNLYIPLAAGYLFLSCLWMLAAHIHFISYLKQTITQIIIDIFVLTFLIHCNIYNLTIFGILINATIAGGSIMTGNRMPLCYAALASLMTTLDYFYLCLSHATLHPTYLQVAVIDVSFFATAILGHVLSRRIRVSEESATSKAQELARMQRLNDYIVKKVDAGIIVIDKEKNILSINKAAEKLLSLSMVNYGSKLLSVSRELDEQLSQFQHDKNFQGKIFQSQNNSLTAKFVDVSNEDLITIIYLEDLSSIASHAQQLKLASLGRLAASIAHEIRNPLAAMSHACELLNESIDVSEENLALVNIIINHTHRVNNVVKNVLQLSQQKPPNQLLIELVKWLKEFIQEQNFAIDFEPSSNTAKVLIDPTHLHQVLTNLIDNAKRYCHSGTNVLIKTNINSSNLHYVEVIDNGPGISGEQLENLFEPFFTTEKLGTGLGLYLSKALCEVNKAQLSYLNTSTGACFRITFAEQLSS